MEKCFSFLRRSDMVEKNTSHGGLATKRGQEKTEFPPTTGANFDSFSSSTALNRAVDSGQASELYQRSPLRETSLQDNDNETKIDLEAAIRAVDVALAGLQVGGKKQGSPTALKQETQTPTPVRSRPGCPPKGAAAAIPRAIRRIARFVTTNPEQRANFQDALSNTQQQMAYQPTRHNSQDFLLNSNDLLNPQLSGYFPNAMDMRSNFSESDMQNAALWGNSAAAAEEWNVQQQLQNFINQHNQGLAATNPVGRNWSADFTGNPQLAKYIPTNAFSDFLVNSSDSWSSKIEVPYQGSVRGDSFSSKIEFPITCDSFTSKVSAASIRDDSFSSQRVIDPLMMNRPPMESMINGGATELETGYNLPELSRQELESLAEGDVSKEVLTETPVTGIQNEAHLRSEKNLLLAITGILRSALTGNYNNKNLLSDLNLLLVSVRRHFMDFQNFSASAAETFILIGTTLPVICLTVQFSDDVLVSLRKFMMMISSGHPTLNNAVCLMEVSPGMELKPTQQNEVFQLLTKIHHKLTNELSNNNATSTSTTNNLTATCQSEVPFTSQEMTGEQHVTEKTVQAVDNASESTSEAA